MKEQILELFKGQQVLTWDVILVNILFSALLGMVVYLSYYLTHRGTIYSKKFNASLVTLTVLTGTVMTVIGNNVALSLGMVGALSIVRFRTAIKDPLDIAFLFWSIGAGIILAAGMIPLAVIGSVCIGLILLVFVNQKAQTHPYMIVLNCVNHQAETKAIDLLNKYVVRSTMKSKSAVKGALEMNIEVRLKEDNTDFINILAEIPGVNSAVIVSYNGDYMG